MKIRQKVFFYFILFFWLFTIDYLFLIFDLELEKRLKHNALVGFANNKQDDGWVKTKLKSWLEMNDYADDFENDWALLQTWRSDPNNIPALKTISDISEHNLSLIHI